MRKVGIGLILVATYAISCAPSHIPPANPENAGTGRADLTFVELNEKVLKRCVGCHSSTDRLGQPQRPAGDIELTSYEKIMSKTGLVFPGDPNRSELYLVLNRASMPPESPRDAEAVAAMENWILSGAIME